MVRDTILAFKTKVASLTYREKVSLGRNLLCSLRARLSKCGLSPSQVEERINSLVRLAVSADGIAGNEEYDLYCNVFERRIPYEHFFSLTNYGTDPEFVSEMNGFIDSLSDDGKLECCEFIFLFLSSDYKFDREEEKLLRLLLHEDL